MPDTLETLGDRFARDGYVSPIRVFSAAQAAAYRARLETAEVQARALPDGESLFREYANIALDFVGEIVASPAVTDPVAELLGEDLLILGCSFFIKEPQTPAFVSWHQDLHYWGLDSDDVLTCWLALSPATVQSGCMRFVPGSHTTMIDHNDTFADENMLTRIFGRLTAWQNWIFQRPNAVGEGGALKVYGTGEKSRFDWNRV